MNFGETLKKIRVEKGLKQKEVCEGITTISYYSRVERGISDPSVHIFLAILNKLNVSFDEFTFINNNYQESEDKQFWTYISNLYHSGNIDELNQIKEKIQADSTNKEKIFFVVIISRFISRLDKELKETDTDDMVIERLMEIENWTSHEVKIFITLMDIFPIKPILILVNHLLKKKNIYTPSKGYNSPYNKMLINAILLCLDANYLEEAESYLYEMKNSLELRDFYCRSFYMYLEGIFLFLKGEREEGAQKVNEFFNICQLLDLDSFSKKYKDYWEGVKKNIEAI
jgi:Rgg/GadR/MutR family transcriptional activator